MRQIHWRGAVLIASIACLGVGQAKTDVPVSPVSVKAPAHQVAQAAQAEQAPVAPQALAPTDVKAYDDWTVRCFPVKSPARCDMFQATVDKTTQRRIVSTSIAYAPGVNGYVTKIIIPLGVQLDGGVAISADGYKSAALAITRCEDDGCYVEGQLPVAVLDKLLAGKSASIVVTLTTGGHATLPLSLHGFSGALAAMKELAVEKSR